MANPEGGPGSVREPAMLTGIGGINPLAQLANPLIVLALPLRSLVASPDIEALRAQIAALMDSFRMQARANAIADGTATATGYCLCAFLDEAIAGTPWGAGVWSSQSLLVRFYNESFGGERFFTILDHALKHPDEYGDLLEVMYVLLSLGFEGRYKLTSDSTTRLAEVRVRLLSVIATVRAPVESALSPQWQGVTRERQWFASLQWLWVAALAAMAIVAVVLLGVSLHIDRAADPAFAALAAIELKTASNQAVPPSSSAQPPRLRFLLAPDIAAGRVKVQDLPDRSVVTLSGAAVFASGSATVDSQFLPVLGRISAALDTLRGDVTVVGYTDNQAPGAGRYTSNWTLSQARAEGVKRVLAEYMRQPQRLSAQGRADTQPLAPNNTAQNRSLNRRVEITLLAPAVLGGPSLASQAAP
jgi:type VI secretion system protein ImpK